MKLKDEMKELVNGSDSAKVAVPKKKHGHGGCGKCRNCSCHKKKAA